ncbi:hypothetical protein Aduo_012189 [Ancylostoma duodenale]
MAKQMQATMATLEDTFANRAIANGQIPYNHSITENGNTLVVLIGDSNYLLNKNLHCDTWTVKFPPSVTDLGVANLTDDTNYRVGIWCYGRNPFMYTLNFNLLITSGALELHLKYLDGSPIVVNDTLKTINITTRAATLPASGSNTMFTPFESYQILDVHTFQTTAWNISIFLEIRPTTRTSFVGEEAYVFISYQRLPGPMVHDHDSMFHIKHLLSTNYIYVSSPHLTNKTGLYYVGIGIVNSTGKDCVEFQSPPGVEEGKWCFVQGFRFDVFARALTKGCYHYDNITDRFTNMGEVAGSYHGDTMVQCLVSHLSVFSVGLFNPEIETDFSFQYISEHREQNITASMIVIVMTVHMLFIMIFVVNCEMIEADKGELFNMADNSNADLYHYAVAVETGYRMYAGTDSKIYVTLYGTEADEAARELSSSRISKNSSVFNWGTTARFLLKTPW